MPSLSAFRNFSGFRQQESITLHLIQYVAKPVYADYAHKYTNFLLNYGMGYAGFSHIRGCYSLLQMKFRVISAVWG